MTRTRFDLINVTMHALQEYLYGGGGLNFDKPKGPKFGMLRAVRLAKCKSAAIEFWIFCNPFFYVL